MVTLKLIKPIKPFWSISFHLLGILIILLVLTSLDFACILFPETAVNFEGCPTKIECCCSWIFFMVSTTNNAPRPVTTPVTPAGLVMDPPLFFDDPVIPGINFLQNIPILNLLPNFFPVQILTPPFFGGMGNLTGIGALIPLATQLAHNVNPTVLPGAGFNVPPVIPTTFWPAPAPLMPNPILDSYTIAGTTSAQLPVILLGSTTLILLATGWCAFSKKKANPFEMSENINPLDAALRAGKPLKHSLPPDEPWKNFNQLSYFRANKTESVSYLQIELVPDVSVKVCGFSVDLGVVPFICMTGSLTETFTALFLALLRKVFVYLIRQQIAGFFKVLLFCKVKNAHLLFFTTNLTENLSKFRRYSHTIIIKTKIVMLHTTNQILQVLNKGNVVWK